MKMNRFTTTLLLTISCSGIASASQTIEPSEILKVVDAHRGLSGDYSNRMKIEVYEDKKLSSTTKYQMWVGREDQERKVLLRYLSPAQERNNLVLFRDNKMWVYNQKTSRPIPVSASQRLSGSASIGDTVNIELQKYYNATIEPEGKKGQINLSLKASNSRALYKQVELTVHAKTYAPIHARFLTKSGKLLKTAHYRSYRKIGRQEVCSEIIIEDALRPKFLTRTLFSSFDSSELPTAYFDKNYLPKVNFEN